MKQIYTMFAGYNRWANRRLYAAARTLPDADYRSPRGAFFGSLHGTLNHLVVADRIWMRRFTGEGPVQTQARRDPVRRSRRAHGGTRGRGRADRRAMSTA